MKEVNECWREPERAGDEGVVPQHNKYLSLSLALKGRGIITKEITKEKENKVKRNGF